MSIYAFCNDCKFKIIEIVDGKIIKYTCPTRFNPFEPLTELDGKTPRTDGREGCPSNLRFMELERKKFKAYDSNRIG